jgi:hypothetical protein
MKIKMSDVDKMIKEEFQKMIGKKKLSTRLSQINEELRRMDTEDSILNEVEASGMQKTQSATGLVPGEQHGVKFEKIGTHLKEDDAEDEMEITVDTPDMGADMDMDVDMGEFEAKFAEIGRAIDAKMGATDNDVEVPEMDAEAGESDEDFEEVEVDADSDIEVGSEEGEEGGEGEEEEEEEEIEEYAENPAPNTHVVGGKVIGDEDGDGKPDSVNESAKKKGSVITEARKSESKNIFTEGVDSKKKAKLLEEFNRMKKFAGLSKDEE